MASTINLTNTEVLDYSHTLNMVGMYQFGRTVNLSLTAFIMPVSSPSPTEVFSGFDSNDREKFASIDTQQNSFIEEILDNGWADSITLGSGSNKETINNVKILSYSFPTDTSNNKINLLRVNIVLEYTESFDNTPSLTEADADIYTNLQAFDYAQYFESFSENYNFSLSESGEFSFQQNVNFVLEQNSSTSVDLVQQAKNLVNSVFLSNPPKLGYLDSRYDNFIQTIKTRGRFSESYDSISNSYSFSRSVNTRSGAHKADQKNENWSAGLDYTIQRDESGIITITENANIQGRLGLESSETDEDLYSNAYAGFTVLHSGSYDRCQALMENMIKDKPDWVQGSESWNLADDLKVKFISFGKNLNRVAGTISYNIVYTNNPRMHEEAIFDYTLSSSKDQEGYVQITESGNISPYGESKNSGFNAKVLYDRFTSSSDVLSRVKVLHESIKDPDAVILENPKNLISSSVSFPAYGLSISYSFVYSDDKSLRDETYVRKLKKNDSFNSPTKITSSVIAPNIKETNYDSNQTSLGKKSLSFECVFKRNPNSNLINKAHTDYLKTSSDSVFNSIKQEVERSAFVNAKQNVSNQLSFFLESMSYNFDSNYQFNSSAEMSFVDRRGVAAEIMEY